MMGNCVLSVSVACVLTLAARPAIYADEPPPPQAEVVMQPLAALQVAPQFADSAASVELSKLAYAKITRHEGKPQLVVLVDQFRSEDQKVTVPVLGMRQEVRTRKVTAKVDGKDVEVQQTYTVNVPFQAHQEVQRPIPMPAGKKPVVIPLDEAKFYRLDGTEMDAAEAEQTLAEMQAAFILYGKDQPPQPASKVIQSALQPTTLIVVTSKLSLAGPPRWANFAVPAPAADPVILPAPGAFAAPAGFPAPDSKAMEELTDGDNIIEK